MQAVLMAALKSVAKSIMAALLTEAFIKEIIVYLLKKLAERTNNKVDDAIVSRVEKALNTAPKQIAE